MANLSSADLGFAGAVDSWADCAYCSAANVALLARRGLVPQFQRARPRGKPMPPHIARGSAGRAQVQVAIEQVFAAQKSCLGLVIRSIGLARAKTKLGLANLVTNMRRLAGAGGSGADPDLRERRAGGDESAAAGYQAQNTLRQDRYGWPPKVRTEPNGSTPVHPA